jgi:hypothetical protein
MEVGKSERDWVLESKTSGNEVKDEQAFVNELMSKVIWQTDNESLSKRLGFRLWEAKSWFRSSNKTLPTEKAVKPT